MCRSGPNTPTSGSFENIPTVTLTAEDLGLGKGESANLSHKDRVRKAKPKRHTPHVTVLKDEDLPPGTLSLYTHILIYLQALMIVILIKKTNLVPLTILLPISISMNLFALKKSSMYLLIVLLPLLLLPSLQNLLKRRNPLPLTNQRRRRRAPLKRNLAL